MTNFDHSTIRHWLQGSKAPRSVASMEVLARIERRYRLPAGCFKTKLPHQTRSASGHILDDTASSATVSGVRKQRRKRSNISD
jgi:hypothetical protein